MVLLRTTAHSQTYDLGIILVRVLAWDHLGVECDHLINKTCLIFLILEFSQTCEEITPPVADLRRVELS